jgi:hypothetical protein
MVTPPVKPTPTPAPATPVPAPAPGTPAPAPAAPANPWYNGLFTTVQTLAWPVVVGTGLLYGFGCLDGCIQKERTEFSGEGPNGQYRAVMSGPKTDNPIMQRPKYANGSKVDSTLDSQLVEMQKVICGPTNSVDAKVNNAGPAAVNNGTVGDNYGNVTNNFSRVDKVDPALPVQAPKVGVAPAVEVPERIDGYTVRVPRPDSGFKEYVVKNAADADNIRAYLAGQGCETRDLLVYLDTQATQRGEEFYLDKEVALPTKPATKPFFTFPKKK